MWPECSSGYRGIACTDTVLKMGIAQLDMFTVRAFEPSLRDNRDVMEFPFLSLQKRRVKAYQVS